LPIEARATVNLKAIELIYSDGRVVLIDNIDEGENRVWVSLSPDREKVLFTVVGQKTYITDLKGNVISYIDEAQAPKWANNNTVVFMKTLDNGDEILRGDIFTYKLNSAQPIILTDAFNDVALFPSMCEDESKVVFSTDKGELYIINLQ
ncbi:MAG: hypothetical protein KAH32_09260, partial [Chlamydiia bacterium]|nr:hypothetical protein [Chlamydiia bacterium]